MPSLPQVSGNEAVAALGQAGFVQVRTGSRNHAIMDKMGSIISVPLHKELRKGTLRRLIPDAGLTVDEFCKLL